MILSIIVLAIAIISSLGSTQSQQDTQAASSCNACCQGHNGHNGLPGRDGLRGERGESGTSIKGDKGGIGSGLPGPEGQRGQKGDQGLTGVGLPGKTGPIGSIGPVGRPGETGISGESGIDGSKGERGESRQIRKSAFTAVKTTGQSVNTGDVITFQKTPTNINGHFSLETNKFTCQIPGTYFFTFSLLIYEPRDLNVHLVKNNDKIVGAHARTGPASNDADMADNSAVLNLEIGDQVWLKGVGANTRYNSHSSGFSGFLLYEA